MDILPSEGDEVAGVRFGAEIAGAMFNSIHRATSQRDPSRRLLVTSVPSGRPLDALPDPMRGVASLEATADVPGTSLRLVIEREPTGTPMAALSPVPELEAARLVRQVLAIVETARGAGVVLRGIHPLLCYADHGRVSEIAPRALNALLSAPPMRGGLCLVDAYAAPEVWRGGRATWRSDVFSTCALGWYLVAGEPPFPGQPTWNDGIAAVLRGTPPAGRAGWLGPILLRGLACDPDERPTPTALDADLDHAARQRTER